MCESGRSKPPAAADALTNWPICCTSALSIRCLSTGGSPCQASSENRGCSSARIVVLGGTAALARVDELDEAQGVQRAHVVGDGAEARMELRGELHRAGAALGEQGEDPDPQRVGERLEIPRIVD